jgi:hypothetical protein
MKEVIYSSRHILDQNPDLKPAEREAMKKVKKMFEDEVEDLK